jgi:preprotein translocase subunit YajC
MSFLISDAHAQAAGAAPQQSPYSFFLMMGVMLVAMYFLLIRPQQKRAKEHQNLLAKLAPGDECVTAGGILGKVTEVGDAFVTVEIADGVRIKLQKSQITQLVPKGTYKST